MGPFEALLFFFLFFAGCLVLIAGICAIGKFLVK